MSQGSSSNPSADGEEPKSRYALAIVCLGAFLALLGGYCNLNGFERPDYRPIGPSAADVAAALGQPGPDNRIAPPPESTSFAQNVMTFFSKDTSTTASLFLIGCLMILGGFWHLSNEGSCGDPAAEYLRSSYRDGLDPASLHSEENLEEFDRAVAESHQRKILWSLPFWMASLILLVVNKGTLGNPTILGISDLWLIGITLGIYFVHVYLNWRCPACTALLPRHDERLICDKCGLNFNTRRQPASYSAPKETA